MLLDSSGNNFNLTNFGCVYDKNYYISKEGNGSISICSSYLLVPYINLYSFLLLFYHII